jgi:arsenate reductase (glutaredoxin)
MKLLESKGVAFDAINYFIEPIDAPTLRTLVEKLGIKPIDLFRKKEPRFKELDLDKKTLSDDDLIEILSANPELIERPIVVRGDKAVLGRPPENINELFR